MPPAGVMTRLSAALSDMARTSSAAVRIILREFPALPEFRFQQGIGLIVVGEAPGLRVPVQLALADPHRDHAEQHPLHERSGDAEVGACGLAAFAGADPVAIMAADPVLRRSG